MSRPPMKPWITPTSREQADGLMAFDGDKLILPGVERDTDGILWQPMPERPSEGNVLWKDMHTGRQKRAMREGLCQVCGQLQAARPISWIIPAGEVRLARPNGRPFRTATPPTCVECIPVALEYCPNLSARAPMVLQVNHWRPVALYGDMITGSGEHVKAEIPLGSSDVARMMARHLVVEVYDYRRAR